MSRAPGEWPYGSGEMARLIRSHNWAKTPLGPIEAWQQSLKTAVDLIIVNPVANILVCGPERVLIYNDGCIHLYRGKHPVALGSRGPDAFPELWGEIGPLYDRVFAGEALRFEAQPWAFERGLAEEAGLYDAFFAPGRDETGQVAFAYVTAIEVTNRVQAEAALRESEERQSFLLRFSDALRAEPNADAIVDRAVRMLAEELRLDRGYAAAMYPAEDRVDVIQEFRRPDLAPMPSPLRFSDFPEVGKQTFDRTLIFNDTANDPELTDTDKHSLAAMSFAALLSSPVRRGAGNPIWALGAVSSQPRRWTPAEVALMEETAERTWAAVERARAEAALGESEEKFSALFAASPAPFLILKPDAPRFTIVEVNETYLAATMRTHEDLVGCGVFEAFPDNPDDATIAGVSTLRASFDRVLASKQPDTLPGLKYDVARPDGTFEERWWSPVNSAVLDENGEVVAIIHNANDVTAEHRAEAALRDSQERIRQFGDASSDVLWIRDAETLQWSYLTPAFETIYGISREEAFKGNNYAGWSDLILPEDRDNALAQVERVRQGESVTFEYRIRRPSDGAIRWLRNTDFPLRDASGRVQSIGGIGEDVTEEKATADRMELMIAELQHRTRNLIGVVRSIASQTLAASPSLDHFGAEFEGRMAALAAVQGLLARSDFEPITIGTLIELELKALGAAASEERMSVEGPPVRLRNSIVQTLALAIHELATNARKHGALATPNGHLSVRWHTAERDSRQHLVIDWYESGIEAQSPNPTGGGYGRKLIEQALPYSVGGKTDFDLTATELRCRIELPLK